MIVDTPIVWEKLVAQARELVASEPLLARLVERCVIGRANLADALAALLSDRLATDDVPVQSLSTLFAQILDSDPHIVNHAARDLVAAAERDPAAHGLLNPFLNHKGFHALQAHRSAHVLWSHGRPFLALHVQSRSAEVFSVDIHPGARLGAGIFIDHGTGVVIGETAVVGDDVSMLQGVTLGGTGKDLGDRHPKIGRGVLLSAGSTVLGNIQIGDGAKVGAGSVVLEAVPPHCTVVGVPGRVIGPVRGEDPGLTMDHRL